MKSHKRRFLQIFKGLHDIRTKPIRTTYGFTLVELLVAMTIASIIFAVAWRFLNSISSSSREITSATSAIDENRSALEGISQTIQVAAAHASPRSDIDPKVQPRNRNTGLITGIYPYQNWQTPTIWNVSNTGALTADVAFTNRTLTANPTAVFDGMVVLGSVSYPLSFETQIRGTNTATLTIPNTPRGLRRLANLHPFIVAETSPSNNTPLEDGQWGARVIRILDGEGFKQFSTIESASDLTSTITLMTPLSPKGPGQNFGVDIAIGADDRFYNTAALDMFWFYVRRDPDPANPFNLQLVRDRLCARTAIPDFTTNPANFNPATHLAGTDNCGRRETLVLANQVASFDVWFECGSSAGIGSRHFPVKNTAAPAVWNITNTACVTPTVNAPYERARIAHVRLSTRPNTERSQTTDNNFFSEGGRMTYFDFNPDYPGAAPVTTLQSDIFMRNFLYW